MKATGLVFKSRDYIGSAEPPATVLEDESRYGNNGTFVGDGEPDWVRLPSGLWVMSYDGNNDKTTLPNSISLKNFKAKTMLMWAKVSAFTGSPRYAYDGSYWIANYGDLWEALDNSNNIRMRVRNTGATTQKVDVGFTPEIWKLFGCLWDGTNVYPCDNGVVGSGEAFSGTMECNIAATLACRTSTFMVVSIGPIIIFNWARSTEYIAAIFQNQRHWFGV